MFGDGTYRDFGRVLAEFVGFSEHEHQVLAHKALMNDELSKVDQK